MELVRDIRALDRGDVARAGGKGAALGDLAHAGFPVPPGFVILSTAYANFVSEAGISFRTGGLFPAGGPRNMEDAVRRSEEIYSLFTTASMPGDIVSAISSHMDELRTPFVAVRSSAVVEDGSEATWAGQFESYLNTTRETLEQNIKRCWASLFTPRAMIYAAEMGIRASQSSMGVVVQSMIASDVSGVAFSVHPVTQERNTLIIEAGLGLGEALVGGYITPDTYLLEKEPLRPRRPPRIVSKELGYQDKMLVSREGLSEWCHVQESQRETQKLPDSLILQLADLVVRVEEHTGSPVDVEWAVAGGRIYLLQSRPITTLEGRDWGLGIGD